MGLLQDSDAARQWFAFVTPGYDTVVSALFWPDWLQQKGIEHLRIDSTDRILDIGCGTGETTRHLLAHVSDVHGLDQSVSQLQTTADKDELDDAQFVQADAHRLPYVDKTFDRIVSIGSILYWATPADVLREAYRVTKPGGSILVMGFHRLPFSAWNPVQNVQEMINSSLFFRYSRDEATQLFRIAEWRDEDHTITGPKWSPNLVIATIARKPA
ncbi:class I SAM-dependent methyltransferase [Natronococcus wangiae]|uniref:class I SAM-dependent methyltransferase n=1 Tax=Natronococcus wangiae TaxID=3068275 RepID=UPI00273E5FF4|nr:class I SAM-dependent methyltransferase [Natronococcus sp. AD5]